jgi:hypothetical protein
MATVKDEYIECDGDCSYPKTVDDLGLANLHLPVAKQRAILKTKGWTRVKGKDLCPSCSYDYKEAQEGTGLLTKEQWAKKLAKVDK